MSKKSSLDLYHQYPLEIWASNPILRTKCDTVDNFDSNLRMLAHDMQKLMRLHHGTWLAAPQIGQTIQLITTIQWKKKWSIMSEIWETVLVNPYIIGHSAETFLSEESCLSLPNFAWYTRRYKKVTVEYQDLLGNKKTREFSDYNAAVLQHEIDHLNGVLFIDKLEKT